MEVHLPAFQESIRIAWHLRFFLSFPDSEADVELSVSGVPPTERPAHPSLVMVCNAESSVPTQAGKLGSLGC